MTTRLRYFAYGSNLLPQRLRERAPSARLVGSGHVDGRTLRFHKLGGDGSGKCDCHATGDPNDRLWGAVYEMDAHEKPDLDAVEGPGYTAIEVEVSLSSSRLTAYTYVAIPPVFPDHRSITHGIITRAENPLNARYRKRLYRPGNPFLI
ncbi:MAG: gamma-glutamylcyclotransferase [Gammaproteobacteria bacterium]|nr:gamma-glutamylcyclotransferase [Gammaproteobacteria bacterium]